MSLQEKFRIKTVYEISYSDLETIIKTVYGHSVELVLEEEWGNDEKHDIIVGAGKLDKWDLEILTDFKETGKGTYGITRILLEDMCSGELLDPGNYLISICW
ncbi:hypothetical protein LCGC14_1672220 [marine sediment metagenome]|uniref:Uncharacterized protein n=1 Tax=marine sediment metagenome TaxID=412755 RepID=A0A0F9IDE6_9ZZZZ